MHTSRSGTRGRDAQVNLVWVRGLKAPVDSLSLLEKGRADASPSPRHSDMLFESIQLLGSDAVLEQH